ncbi:hypothetical protein IJ556_02045, partial [bacterium]|nr:hypothetical protein [bacterium]
MVSINTNLQSLIVQKNLTKSTNALDKAIERLTTGYKINHASDNAANYSITRNMSSQLSSYLQAEENTSMGLDLIQTQSSTLDTIQNLTTRLRALAEQAHNGTYGAQSLQAINQEAGAIVDEICRITGNTEYNGIDLMGSTMQDTFKDSYGETIGLDEYEDISIKSNGLINEVEEFVDPNNGFVLKISNVDENINLNSVGATFIISSAEDFKKFSYMMNNGHLCNNDHHKFVLTNDIDLSEYSDGEGFAPINFKGTFDGNGHTISNLYINRPDEDNVGLFRSAVNEGESGTIKNLRLENVNITGDSYVGAVCDRYVKIENVAVTGEVKANGDYAGLIAGGDC